MTQPETVPVAESITRPPDAPVTLDDIYAALLELLSPGVREALAAEVAGYDSVTAAAMGWCVQKVADRSPAADAAIVAAAGASAALVGRGDR